jgi:hypothetical protein
VQNAEPFLEAVAEQAMQLALDVLVLGVASACGILCLGFVVAVAAGIISELRGDELRRNVLSRPT